VTKLAKVTKATGSSASTQVLSHGAKTCDIYFTLNKTCRTASVLRKKNNVKKSWIASLVSSEEFGVPNINDL